MSPLPRTWLDYCPQKMHILPSCKLQGLHSSKVKIQGGWMENQEESSPGGDRVWRGGRFAKLPYFLSVTKVWVKSVIKRKWSCLSPKKNGFNEAFPAKLELRGWVRPCALLTQAAPTVRDAGPSYSGNTEPQMSPSPQDRGITQSQTFVLESNIQISCLLMRRHLINPSSWKPEPHTPSWLVPPPSPALVIWAWPRAADGTGVKDL